MIVKPTADSLLSQVRDTARRGPPPVHLWNPPFCGDIDIRIARDGTWFYLGTPIGRAPLVKLFSSILKLEDDQYYLVTPVEKVRIRVDDTPLHAIDFSATGTGPDQILHFTTKTDDEVDADAAHPLNFRLNPDTGEPSPYIHVRAGLNALIDRKTFYRLVDLGCHNVQDRDSWFGLWSHGQFFPIISSAELP